MFTVLELRSVLLGILLLTISLSSTAQRVSATVGVGNSPAAIAVNPVTNRIYVANRASNTVTVMDGSSNSTATVNTGTGPQAIAVNPATNKIYVANQTSNNVTVINGVDNTTIAVNVGTGPQAIAVNPLTNRIYVANTGSNSVTVINGDDNSTTSVSVGTGPQSIAVNPATNKTYVANTGSNNVTVIDGTDDLNTTTTVGAGTGPLSVAVNPVTNKIYVANHGSNNMTVINGTDNSTTAVSVGTGPQAIAVNPASNMTYVANGGSHSLTVIDGANNPTLVAAGTNPVSIAVNLVTNMIYVANHGSKNVTVIDGSNNPTTLTDANANGPQAVAVNPVTNKIYVANQSSNNVTAIDGAINNTVTTASGAGRQDIALNPVTNKFYVLSDNGNIALITEIDGATNNTSTINIVNGVNPFAIAVNPITNKIYVTYTDHATFTDRLAVIDGATHATTATVRLVSPRAIAINVVTNKIYVTQQGGVAIIDGNSNAVTTVIAGGDPNPPVAIAVNPVTNKIYAVNCGCASVFPVPDGTVTVLDGATNSFTLVPAGNRPRGIVVNSITNKIYVNDHVIDGATNTSTSLGFIGPSAINPLNNRFYVVSGSDLKVLDGATNAVIDNISGVAGNVFVNPVTNKIYVWQNNGAESIIDGVTDTVLATLGSGGKTAVNPITNKIYVNNFYTNDVTVITEQQVNAIPLTTTITPFPNNQTTFPAPTVFFSTNSTYTPNTPPVQNVFYQVDTWQGPWLPATGNAPSFQADLPVLRPGTHILYAYATDAQQGDSTQTGNGSSGQSSPIIGQIAAYLFVVIPSSSSPTAILNVISNPSVFNQSVTFTDMLSSTTATNTVSFYENYPTGLLLGTVAVNSGKATLSTSGLSGGTHPITAVYSGDAMLLPAISNTVYQVVNKAPVATALALTSGTNPSTAGTSLTFTATVSPQFGGIPTGTVTFMDGNATLGIGTPGGAGVWTFTTSSLTAGVHSITAVYGGDGNFAAGTSPAFSQVIESNAGGASTIVLTANGATGTITINFGIAKGVLPSQQASFAVTVTGSTDGDSVVLLDGNRQLGPTLTLAGGQASYASQLPAGQHNVQAVYIGNGSVSGSVSAVVNVDRSPRPRPR